MVTSFFGSPLLHLVTPACSIPVYHTELVSIPRGVELVHGMLAQLLVGEYGSELAIQSGSGLGSEVGRLVGAHDGTGVGGNVVGNRAQSVSGNGW